MLSKKIFILSLALALSSKGVLADAIPVTKADPIKGASGEKLRPNGRILSDPTLGGGVSDTTPNSSPAPRAAQAAAVSSSGTLLDGMKTTFSQATSGYPNELIGTVDNTGNYRIFLYVNDYIGYVDPINGNLLYCGNFQPDGQYASLYVIDCRASGNISSISSYATYSNGQYVRDGSTFYYENGKILKTYYGDWYYDNGQILKNSSSYSSEIRYRDGRYFKYGYYFYHPTGQLLSDSSSLYYSNGNGFTNGSYAVFKDRSRIATSLSGDRNFYWYNYYSSYMAASYSNNDSMVQMYYPDYSGSTLKRDSSPFVGHLYTQYGSETTTPIHYTQSVSQGGAVFIDARRDRDLLAYTLTDGGVTHVVYQSRISPPLANTPINVAVSGLSARFATLTWSNGGGDTASYGFAFTPGSGNPLTCANTNNWGTSTLAKMSNLSPSTTYRFVICAKNSIGMFSDPIAGTFQTTPLIAPPAPKNLAASSISWGSFTASWTPAGGNASSYFLAVAEGSVAPNCTLGSESTDLYRNISSLKEQTDYTVSVCSKNVDGLYSSSVHMTVHTIARPRPPKPTNFTVVDAYDTIVDLSWSSTGGDSNGFYVLAKEGGNPTSCRGVGEKLIAFSSNVNYRLHPLKPATSYGIALCARSKLGDGFESLPIFVSATTAPITPPPAPTAPVIMSLKAMTASLEWTSGGANTVGFRFAYVEGSSAPNCASLTAGFSAPTMKVSLSALKPDTQYTGAVCAYSEVPRFSDPVVVSFHTLPPPPSPVGLMTVFKHDTYMKIGWSSGGGSTLKYVLAYRAGSIPPVNCKAATGVVIVPLAKTVESYEFKTLKPSQALAFSLCAQDEFNLYSLPAQLNDVTDPATAPPPPNSLAVSEIKPTSVKLSWASGGYNTLAYKVVAIPLANAAVDCSKGVVNATAMRVITGLKPATDYTFGVCAYSASAKTSPVATIQGNTRRLPLMPDNFRISSQTDTSMFAEWNPADSDTVSYILSVIGGSVPPACGASNSRTYRIKSLSQDVISLAPNTSYALSICSVNSDGQISKPAATVVDKTDVKTAPPTPLNLSATSLKGASATFEWDSAGYNTSQYRIAFVAGENLTLSCTATGSFFVKTPMYVRTNNLVPGTKYTLAVCAYSASGLYSAPIRLTVETMPPPAVADLTITKVTTTSISVSYKSALDGTAGYRVAVVAGGTADCATQGVNVTTPTYTKTGLVRGTQYTIAVCARAANGTLSVPSVAPVFTLP